MTRVACIGGAVLDLVYRVEALPGRDGKFPALSHHEGHGGMAANAAVTVRRLGGQATWWGRLGNDETGRRVLGGLEAEGVAAQGARIIAGAASSHSVVLEDGSGNRAIVLFCSPALDNDPSWLPLGEIAGFDAVLADNRWVEGAEAALGAAREAGRPAVLDADAGTGAATLRAIEAASHAVFSEGGLAECFGSQDVDHGLAQAAALCPFVAVTLGAQGVRWRALNMRRGTLPAFGVRAVETAGAGDVFHGAFALALAEGQSDEDSLRFASAAATLKCANTGGRRSFPGRDAVERMLRGA